MGTADHHAFLGKLRLLIPLPIWLQKFQFPDKRLRYVFKGHCNIDPHPGDKVLLRQTLPGILIQASPELVHVLFLQGKPRCHGMAPKLQQQVLHLHQGMEHVVGLYGTPGAFGAALCPGQHKGGLVISLPEPSRHDPGQ